MLSYYDLPDGKKAYAQRGNQILREIEAIEKEAVQSIEDKRKLKHLWKQFHEVFNFVFDNNK